MNWPRQLLTNAEMAAADARAVAHGISIDQLMRAAGEAVAARTSGIARAGSRIAVLCGSGNNGGDGYVAAKVLKHRGYHVRILSAAEPKDGPSARAAGDAKAAGCPADALLEFQPDQHDIIVDALYGAGLSRPIAGVEAEAIARVNASKATTISVDVPSGLSGDNGQPIGSCIEADHTVTFFRLKPGHLLWPGRGLCGEISCAEIGLGPSHVPGGSPLVSINRPELWASAISELPLDTHKYRRGDCLVVSGSEFRTGASRLSAIAALNAGCGAVTIAGDPDALRVHAAHVTAIMLQPVRSAEELSSWIAGRKPSSAVIGPAAGVGRTTRDNVQKILDAGVAAVLDADALTSLVGHHGLLKHRASPSSPLVLTPHAGEFARLFPDLDHDVTYRNLCAELRRSKVEKARASARLIDAVIVFKGVDTVIADPDGRASINVNAGPELATAGSGDVLCGLVGAHLAQGWPAFEAAAAAVWLHSELGRQIGLGLTADKLAAASLPLLRIPGLKHVRGEK